MSGQSNLHLLGQGKKGLRIHDLVKAPANTPWAKARQQSWDASEPATVYTTPEALPDGTPCTAATVILRTKGCHWWWSSGCTFCGYFTDTRDDLTNDILMAAEGIFRRVSPHQSKAVRALAERIKKTFADFRTLLKKYEQNIEVVDPQLKNNVELVEILVEFENTWTQGLTYFMDSKKCH